MNISNEERIKLVMAKDWWETDDLGGKLGKIKASDGPVGLRCLAVTDSWENDSIYPSVAYPCYQMLSQTSNLSVKEIKAPGNATLFLEMVIDFIKKEEFRDFIKVVLNLFK